MTLKNVVSYGARIALLCVVFAITFIAGAMGMDELLPAGASEPGLLPETLGLGLIVLAHVLPVSALVLASRWGGWKLALALAVAYYGVVTFMMQIETWYFLSNLTVGPELLPRLFLMGVPPAVIFIPLAVWVLGKGRAAPDPAPNRALMMPAGQWVWKLAVLALAYVLLYWSAGYFIAWQNPELRAFYGQPGPALPFFEHIANTLRTDPWLFPFQLLRGVLWALFLMPLIRGSRLNAWWTALLVGLLVSLPQNAGHVLANPLMPIASVRLSHLIETASSTFVFGLLVVWLLHRAHYSLRDLFGLEAAPRLGSPPLGQRHPV